MGTMILRPKVSEIKNSKTEFCKFSQPREESWCRRNRWCICTCHASCGGEAWWCRGSVPGRGALVAARRVGGGRGLSGNGGRRAVRRTTTMSRDAARPPGGNETRLHRSSGNRYNNLVVDRCGSGGNTAIGRGEISDMR